MGRRKKEKKASTPRMGKPEKRRLVAFLKSAGHDAITMTTPAKELRKKYKEAVAAQKTSRVNKAKVQSDIISARKVKKKPLKRTVKGGMIKPNDWRQIPDEDIAAMKLRGGKRVIVIRDGAKWEYDA